MDGLVVFATQWTRFTPFPCPIQRDATNQKPLFIVFKQSIAAAFKSPRSFVMARANHRETAPAHHTETFPTETVWMMDPTRRRGAVCRSLFGPVDHEQLRRELKLKLKEITEQDSRRWNFNFQTEAPLPGRFQWEEVPANCAASFYQECAPPRDGGSASGAEDDDRLSSRAESSGTDQENCSRISNTRKCPAEVTPARRKRALSKQIAKPRHNTRITGEEQALRVRNECVGVIMTAYKWPLWCLLFFLGRLFRKEEEDDDRKQEHSASFSPKFHWSSSVQINTMKMMLLNTDTVFSNHFLGLDRTRSPKLSVLSICLMLFYFVRLDNCVCDEILQLCIIYSIYGHFYLMY